MPASVDKLLNSQYVQLGLAALAFLIALWFVVVIARMLIGGRLRLPGGRTRQARLGIVDAFDLDRQRQLIIVRRDNTEHLIMIGGPNDLLIEAEIVRVEARDARDARRDDVRRLDQPAGANGAGAPSLNEPFAPLGLPAAPPAAALPAASSPTMPPIAPGISNRTAPVFSEGGAAILPGDPLVGEPLPLRGPTFPLPPRRPAAPTLERDQDQAREPTRDQPRVPSQPRLERQPSERPPSERQPSERQASLDQVMTGLLASSPSAMRDGATQSRSAESDQPPAPPSGQALARPPIAGGPAQPSAPGAAAPPRPAPPPFVAGDRPVPTRPSTFLKPLPPRPPLRPLKRVTPQAEPGADLPPQPPVLPAGTPPVAAPQSLSELETRPAVTTPHPAPASSLSEPVAEKDGLESLEEEMAKLLGR